MAILRAIVKGERDPRKLAQFTGSALPESKLATHIYRLLSWGKPYVDERAEAYEKRHQQARINYLNAAVRDSGYQLTPIRCSS